MRQTVVARTLTALIAVVVTSAVVLVPASEARADGNLEWDSTLTYRVMAEEGMLNMVSEITLTNRQPNGRDGNTIIQYYFDRIGIYVPVEAEGLKVTSGERDLDYTISEPEDEEAEGMQLVEIRLARRIFYKRSTDVRVEFNIRGNDPRSDSIFRINPAYAGFGVVAWGDPGRIEVNVIIDDDFDVTATGSSYSIDRDGQDVIYTITDIEDPAEWFMYFTARNDAELETETVTLGDFEVVVRGWPGDTFWSDEVEDTVKTGVPVLQEMVDLEWRPEADFTILESIEPNVLGYGGWYLDTSEVVEIGEYVDPHLVLHEIGHTWFNDDLFEERWITEGLADEFAAASVERMGETSWYEREMPARNGPYSYPLNEWQEPEDFTRREGKLEEYGYQTSWWLMHELVEEIGIDAMAAVIAAADADQIAYRGAGEPEPVDPFDDWRRMLDLLQEVGGSETAPDLFAEWVLGDEDVLTDRAAARATYATLVEAADGWGIPMSVRTHMSDWEFGEADAAMTEASQVIIIRDEIRQISESLGAVAPASLEAAFEGADIDLAGAQTIAEAQRDAAQQVLLASNLALDQRNPLEVIGLIGEHPDVELSGAIDAFESDDLDTAIGDAAELSERMRNAQSVGLSRVIKASIAVALLVVMLLALVVWSRRRARKTTRDDEEAIALPDEAAVS